MSFFGNIMGAGPTQEKKQPNFTHTYEEVRDMVQGVSNSGYHTLWAVQRYEFFHSKFFKEVWKTLWFYDSSRTKDS